MPIRLMENFRALFYAPYYAAYALGFYQRAGVEVELLTSDAPGDAIPALLDGTIDLTWGGPMRVMKARDADSASPLVCFCEMVARDPFFLIGRRGLRPFELSQLRQLRFASVAEVPTPWLCLQHDLRERGVDPAAVPRIADRPMARNDAALRAGDLDVMQAFEPYASLAESDGAGEVLYAASDRGPTVYTAFIATRDGVARHRDAFRAMTRAVAELQQWLSAGRAEDLAAAAAAYFPGVPADILVRAFQRYRAAGVWAGDPAMSKAGFTRLAESLHSGGFIARLPRYDDCVEQSIAEEAAS